MAFTPPPDNSSSDIVALQQSIEEAKLRGEDTRDLEAQLALITNTDSAPAPATQQTTEQAPQQQQTTTQQEATQFTITGAQSQAQTTEEPQVTAEAPPEPPTTFTEPSGVERPVILNTEGTLVSLRGISGDQNVHYAAIDVAPDAQPTAVTTREDGVEVRTYEGGIIENIRPDQSRLVIDQNTGRRTVYQRNGDVRVEFPNGSQIITRPDGSRVEVSPEGTRIFTKDGASRFAPVTPTNIPRNQDGSVNVDALLNVALTDPNAIVGSAGAFNPVLQTPSATEFLSNVNITGATSSNQSIYASAPQEFQVKQAVAAKVGDKLQNVSAIIGLVREEDIAKAAEAIGITAEEDAAFREYIESERERIINFPVDPRATVREQYAQLMGDVESGETPAWATAAVRAAEAALARRGLSGSSLAGAAISTAIMEQALPIASQDAQVFQNIQLEKFSAQAALGTLRASHLANLNITEIANKQQAELTNAELRTRVSVRNADAFLNMNLANVEREQQTAIFNSQSRLQALLSDQASENATQQFNITNETQTKQFFAELGLRARQFNASQTLSNNQFNAAQEQQRQQFNETNRILIEQSNVEYLRRINTTNTAVQNEANLVNAQNAFNLTNTSVNNALALARDRESYVFQASQNQEERALRRSLAELEITGNLKVLDRRNKFALGQAIGGLAVDVLKEFNVLGGGSAA